jgi:hypothetical protein
MLPGMANAANIHELIGKVFINNKKAEPTSIIHPGDLVTTGHGGRISFSVNKDAFMLKERTSMRIESNDNFFINSLRLLTGKLLSVFEKGDDRKIITSTATIGIRGTGCFLSVMPYTTYFCTCYGKTQLRAQDLREEFEATHHNAHQLDFDGMSVMGMHAMRVIDHSDDELRQLEGYVGRVPFFDRP